MDEVTFWATGERDGDCLLWPLSGNQGGYGHVWLRGRLRQTHRLAWELTHGPIPPGLCVLHRCDVRRCYNPDHLWVGKARLVAAADTHGDDQTFIEAVSVAWDNDEG